jgi:hypothetical protein
MSILSDGRPAAISDGAYGSETVGGRVDQHAGLVQVRLAVQGVTALLQNAMSEQQLLDIWFKRKAPKTASRRQPREEAESKLHRLPDGRPHVPPKALYGCFINAGQFVRLDGKRQVSTADRTILPSMLTLLNQELPITLPDSEESAPWEVDIQQGRNPNGGEAVCIIRPRFDLWQLSFTVEVDQQLMSLSMARDLIDIAGRRIGLLEFSPRHRGQFGCFRVSSWRTLSAKVE